jgi:hypothetical protein
MPKDVARMWHDSGMAKYKVGTALVCTKDFGKIKQGEKGAIVKEVPYSFFSGSDWYLSFNEGKTTEICPDDKMDPHFVII